MTGRRGVGRPPRSRAVLALTAGVALTVLLPTVTLLVGMWLAGWRLQPVETASMQPAHPVGSLLAVAPVALERLEPGRVVVFSDPARPDRLVAHRITERLPGTEPRFHTKGDANPAPDVSPVSVTAMRGEARWHIPEAGRLVQLLRWPRNVIALVAAPALVLALTEIAAWRRRAQPSQTVSPSSEPAASVVL